MTNWISNLNVVEEQKKSDFLEHLYQVYKPSSHHYTGLWQRFCIEEAGPSMRDRYFEMLEAVKIYEASQGKALEQAE
jgi:hypothetical protein